MYYLPGTFKLWKLQTTCKLLNDRGLTLRSGFYNAFSSNNLLSKLNFGGGSAGNLMASFYPDRRHSRLVPYI
ncbi:hypothetical protein OIU74_019176 [Salix koriyanagi]|uniref:Uncharacterized protein n=1 Tax=Salix koriyanagi TaxID=2511006 RepID=A0A9Q0WTX7_9ROSI|nr:hypothetical protein OIU74_019176 [Salix koriyanagi]